MADHSIQRRLAAILAADVAGYTRLMEEDSDGTVAAWQDARAASTKQFERQRKLRDQIDTPIAECWVRSVAGQPVADQVDALVRAHHWDRWSRAYLAAVRPVAEVLD